MIDTIYREDAIKAVKNVSENYTKEGDREWHPHIDFITQALVEVPSIPSEDRPSNPHDITYINALKNRIKELEADRPQGEWVDRSDGGRILNPWWETYECSKCGQYGTRIWHFCPNCGADMRERKESE